MGKKKFVLTLSLLAALVIALVFPTIGLAQSAGLILKPFEGLKGKEREQRLSEGAKKEGKVIVYSFTAVD